MQLIPDTNLLIYLAKYKILDELNSYDLIVPRRVIEELVYLSKDRETKMDDRTNAVIALEFLKNRKIKIIKQRGHTDDIILDVAKKYKIAIATMDKELSSRANKANIKVIKLMQKKYLK